MEKKHLAFKNVCHFHGKLCAIFTHSGQHYAFHRDKNEYKVYEVPGPNHNNSIWFQSQYRKHILSTGLRYEIFARKFGLFTLQMPDVTKDKARLRVIQDLKQFIETNPEVEAIKYG